MAKNNNGTRHHPKPTLMAIGGHESKEGEMEILRLFAERAKPGRLVIATLASEVADEIWQDYRRAFHSLGAKSLVHLNIQERTDTTSESSSKYIDDVEGVFFTGGEQLRL